MSFTVTLNMFYQVVPHFSKALKLFVWLMFHKARRQKQNLRQKTTQNIDFQVNGFSRVLKQNLFCGVAWRCRTTPSTHQIRTLLCGSFSGAGDLQVTDKNLFPERSLLFVRRFLLFRKKKGRPVHLFWDETVCTVAKETAGRGVVRGC